MELSWNGTDITGSVNITGCVHTENAYGRCDCLELMLDNAGRWYGYAPEEDDEIIFTHDGYTTGSLYLNAIIPVGDQYRVLATSTKQAAARQSYETYKDTTLQGLFTFCAAEIGMEGKLFGVDGRLPYTFVLRPYEGAGAFLNRVGEWEGLCVKTRDNAILGVSVTYAQEMETRAGIYIDAIQEGVTWQSCKRGKYASLTVQTPWAKATAWDTGMNGINALTITNLPAMDNTQAGRWARGLLLMHNRQAETLEIEKELDTSLAPMDKVNISGDTAMNGDWIVNETEHDFINKRTTLEMLRCIETVK